LEYNIKLTKIWSLCTTNIISS